MRQIFNFWILVSVLLIPTLAFASTLQELDARNKQDLQAPHGKEDEKAAVKELFSGGAAFLKTCVPANAKQQPKALQLFFEILPTGQMGEIGISPDDAVGQCVKNALKNRAFTPRPKAFVAQIKLRFK